MAARVSTQQTAQTAEEQQQQQQPQQTALAAGATGEDRAAWLANELRVLRQPGRDTPEDVAREIQLQRELNALSLAGPG